MVSQARHPAAPIDTAALARSLQAFGESVMLPRAAYEDPAVFAWEQKYFFDSGWACVGFSSQLPEPGDQRAESVGAGSVLLTRDEDGTLHAFANTCRHRGHELLPCGVTAQNNSIICPYHSWTYSLSGGLRFAQGFKGREGFDNSAWGLVELPVADWHGLIFVDGSGQAPPLATRWGNSTSWSRPMSPSGWSPRGGTNTTPRRTGRSSPRTTTSATTAR